ncbi:hypothetical protein ACOT10_14915 [Providencia manganoxydans]|nr:hypothetical protein [Providencia stuartii]
MMTFDKKDVDSFKMFLEELIASDTININTAKNLRNSSLRLLTVINQEEAKDLTAIDINRLAERFSASVAPPPTEGSLNTYKSRFERALSLFISDENTPKQKSSSQPKLVTKPSTTVKNEKIIAVSKKEDEMSGEGSKVKTFKLPIPLREDFIVQIDNLPQNLTSDEAERIATIIKSFAVTK